MPVFCPCISILVDGVPCGRRTEKDPSPTGTQTGQATISAQVSQSLGPYGYFGGCRCLCFTYPPVSMTVALTVFLSYRSSNILQIQILGHWSEIQSTSCFWWRVSEQDTEFSLLQYRGRIHTRSKTRTVLARHSKSLHRAPSTIHHIPSPPTRTGQTIQKHQIRI